MVCGSVTSGFTQFVGVWRVAHAAGKPPYADYVKIPFQDSVRHQPRLLRTPGASRACAAHTQARSIRGPLVQCCWALCKGLTLHMHKTAVLLPLMCAFWV